MTVKKVKDINLVPALLKELNEFLRHNVHIGIFKEDSEETLIIARTHEYGANITVTPKMRAWFAYRGTPLKATTKEINIPERSFMRSAWERSIQKKINNYTQKAVHDIVSNKKSAKSVLEEIGKIAVQEIQETMRQLKQPPLSTPNDNPRNNPLVATGTLLSAVTYKIKKR